MRSELRWSGHFTVASIHWVMLSAQGHFLNDFRENKKPLMTLLFLIPYSVNFGQYILF